MSLIAELKRRNVFRVGVAYDEERRELKSYGISNCVHGKPPTLLGTGYILARNPLLLLVFVAGFLWV